MAQKPLRKRLPMPNAGPSTPAMQRGRPVANAGPSRPVPSVVPDPTQNMPADRMMYHRNKNVQLAPNTPGNRYMGNVGRVMDPYGRPLEGIEGQVVRKGYPTDAPYSGNLSSKVDLALNRVGDTVEGMDQQITGTKPFADTPSQPTRPAPRAATNSPGGMPQRRPPPAGATLAGTMNGMPNTPGYEPFPGKKKRR